MGTFATQKMAYFLVPGASVNQWDHSAVFRMPNGGRAIRGHTKNAYKKCCHFFHEWENGPHFLYYHTKNAYKNDRGKWETDNQ